MFTLLQYCSQAWDIVVEVAENFTLWTVETGEEGEWRNFTLNVETGVEEDWSALHSLKLRGTRQEREEETKESITNVRLSIVLWLGLRCVRSD